MKADGSNLTDKGGFSTTISFIVSISGHKGEQVFDVTQAVLASARSDDDQGCFPLYDQEGISYLMRRLQTAVDAFPCICILEYQCLHLCRSSVWLL